MWVAKNLSRQKQPAFYSLNVRLAHVLNNEKNGIFANVAVSKKLRVRYGCTVRVRVCLKRPVLHLSNHSIVRSQITSPSVIHTCIVISNISFIKIPIFESVTLRVVQSIVNTSSIAVHDGKKTSSAESHSAGQLGIDRSITIVSVVS